MYSRWFLSFIRSCSGRHHHCGAALPIVGHCQPSVQDHPLEALCPRSSHTGGGHGGHF